MARLAADAASRLGLEFQSLSVDPVTAVFAVAVGSVHQTVEGVLELLAALVQESCQARTVELLKLGLGQICVIPGYDSTQAQEAAGACRAGGLAELPQARLKLLDPILAPPVARAIPVKDSHFTRFGRLALSASCQPRVHLHAFGRRFVPIEARRAGLGRPVRAHHPNDRRGQCQETRLQPGLSAPVACQQSGEAAAEQAATPSGSAKRGCCCPVHEQYMAISIR